MTTKTFEVLDRGTFIPTLAVRLQPESDGDQYLFARSGFGIAKATQAEFIILMRLSGHGEYHCEYQMWGGRTMPVAHKWISEHWDLLPSGSVVDVEFILQETTAPKQSESIGAALF